MAECHIHDKPTMPFSCLHFCFPIYITDLFVNKLILFLSLFLYFCVYVHVAFNRYPSLLFLVPFHNTVKFTVIKILKLIVVVVVARSELGSLCPGYNGGTE